MQYARSFRESVSKTWNSINPATLSGAIDVVVVEQEDGSLACSPFHVRFGKFSLLRPYEKKVEFKVNGVKQNFSMKLGEGGEAFFVFETSDDIPEALQTSPLVSPASSPKAVSVPDSVSTGPLQEPEYLDLSADIAKKRPASSILQPVGGLLQLSERRAKSDVGKHFLLNASKEKLLSRLKGNPTTLSVPGSIGFGEHISQELTSHTGPSSRATLERSASEELLSLSAKSVSSKDVHPLPDDRGTSPIPAKRLSTDPSASPPPLSRTQALNRAVSLSKKLSISNIRTHVTETGDLMLDMTGYKSSEDEALRAEVIARKILAEELEGNYDIGALIGADEHGNLWIYSSEEAKEAASHRAASSGIENAVLLDDAASDPGYHSDDEAATTSKAFAKLNHETLPIPISQALDNPGGDPNRNYAKTLRLTSGQLKALSLKPGPNSMSFSVNRAVCQANMYYWSYNVPVVISDIDGTITKSDALGHVLNMIGRDWTHIGVAKLYTDITANGYNILYLTSRSVGQADTTRAYLHGVVQEGYRLPKGPVILSPDRTIAALRREIYLRKPEVFKMACLRDIHNLFVPQKSPFYAGFGNRLTDALSYRSVNIPSTRIFTINSNAEVSLDLLSLNTYKSSYVTMREIVDHFFPPISLLVTGGGEEFTDFNYWRDPPLDPADFSASEGEHDSNHIPHKGIQRSLRSEDEGSDGLDDDEEEGDVMQDSMLSQDSADYGDDLVDSILESVENEASRLAFEERIGPRSNHRPITEPPPSKKYNQDVD